MPSNAICMKQLLVVLMFSSVSYGAISACATASTGTVLTGLSGSGNGCAAVDLSFENLAVTNSSATGPAFNAPTTANTALYTTSSTPVGNIIATAGLTINPVNGGDWERTTGNNTSTMTATFSWVTFAHTGGTYGSGTPYSLPDPGNGWFFDAITLLTSGNVTSIAAGNSITVAQTICLNALTTASCGVDSLATITATYNPGAGTTAAFSCSTGSASLSCINGNSGLDILNSLHVTQIAFSTAITLNRTGSGTVDLNYFTTNYDQFADAVAPEPSTFGLMGVALAGLGALKRCRGNP